MSCCAIASVSAALNVATLAALTVLALRLWKRPSDRIGAARHPQARWRDGGGRIEIRFEAMLRSARHVQGNSVVR